jgi:hypothetical protein
MKGSRGPWVTLGAKRVPVQPYRRELPGPVVNRHHIKTAGTLAQVTFRQKALRRANYNVLYFSGNAQFRQRG